MPYSFTQVEKDKSFNIGFVFLFLILFYFVVSVGFYYIAKVSFLIDLARKNSNVRLFTLGLSLNELLASLVFAFIVGISHWAISTINLVGKLLNILRAEPIDPKDRYHAVFKNILDEISVATGGSRFEGVVISSLAMNAFALSDLSGRQVIGVTEGLLSKLNRSQLEAVVAHEAAHILKGDCLETTITTSLFDLYGDLLKSLNDDVVIRGSQRESGGGILFFVLINIFLSCTIFISKLFNMFISREREYRADAIAVRLTRDPLSLAEALYQISNRWRGFSSPGENLEAIFIMSPQYSPLDENEGMWGDLFSTHPPVDARLKILLDMAHADKTLLEEKFKSAVNIKQPAPEEVAPQINIQDAASTAVQENDQYYVHVGSQWQGPFNPVDLIKSGNASYDSWICKKGTTSVVRLFESDDLKRLFNVSTNYQDSLHCPHCQVRLVEDMYKGAEISRCQQCSGVLSEERHVERILIREDYFFSDKVKEAAEHVRLLQNKCQIKSIDIKSANLLVCPVCKGNTKMLRNFYTLAYPIEIDRCVDCSSIWFDKQELEILQYLVQSGRR